MSEVSEVNVSKPSKKKIIIIFLCILFLLVLLGYRILANFQTPNVIAEDLPVNVRVMAAELMSIYSAVPISGRIQPIEEVIIMPLATGEVTRVHVRMGDKVERGARLFDIDMSQMAATLNQARANLNQANEIVSSHRTSLERMQTLYAEGAISLQTLEQTQTQYITARESANAAREAVNAASNAAGNANVTAPISGYVTSLNVSVGSMASPGVAAASIADVSELEINTSVSEYLAHRITAGTPVEIRIATLRDRVYSGVITAISPAPAAGGLTYPVRISVDNESGDIMAGMFAEINLIADERDMVIGVPSDAVIIRGGRSVVVVIDDENIPELRDVTVGIDNGIYAEITSGLAAGEVIAVIGQHFVNEGEAVNIID